MIGPTSNQNAIHHLSGDLVTNHRTINIGNSNQNQTIACRRNLTGVFIFEYGFLAQLAEHSAVNRRVVGSSPTVSAPDSVPGTRYRKQIRKEH